MLQTRTDVKAVPCERCRIIRSFIMFVIMLVLLALVAGDKLAYLNFLDAEFFAALIMIVGGVGFIVKLVYWKFFSQDRYKDRLAVPYQSYGQFLLGEKTGHRYIQS